MSKTKRIVIVSVLSCLSVTLDIIKEFLPFFNLPSGGSINISLIPLFVACFVFGTRDGLICSILSFIVSSLLGLNSYYLSISQYLFDYIFPTVVIGFSAVLYKNKNIKEMELGIVITMFLRTLSIVISGAFFWLESTMIAGSKEAFIGSIVYNVPYSIITLVVLMIVVPFITKIVNNYLI